RLFERLSVFAGGWTLDGAESVIADGELPRSRVLDVLERLIDKSLVIADQTDTGIRYGLLESLHHFAREHLEHSPEQSRRVLDRHLLWMLSLAQRIDHAALAPEELASVETEQDNLRAALRFAIESDQAELAIRLAVAAAPLWNFRGQYTEGRTWLRALLA